MSYSLYYWPIPFRGHFIRMILAQVGADWDEPGFDALSELKGRPPADQPYPFMAPPLLHDRDADRWLSQMPAIVMYLGRKHGLSRDADLELRLICDASDILLEITRSHGAQMWDGASWAEFTAARLPRWMAIHQVLADRHGLTGDTPGLAELILAALWHTMVDRLPGLRPLLCEHAPGIAALGDRVAGLPWVSAMLDDWQDRTPRYCGGQIEASILAMLRETAP